MTLNLTNLDAATRKFIEEEIAFDIAAKRLYIGKYLSPQGIADYPGLLTTAGERHDDTWLAAQLRTGARLLSMVPRRTPSGGTTTAAVPSNAHEMLAEGEFNRFYIRGLCRRAIAEKIPHLVIYRAKAVNNPRPESEARVGATVEPQKLLDDLRANLGVDTALGVPAGPNSGLSARLP